MQRLPHPCGLHAVHVVVLRTDRVSILDHHWTGRLLHLHLFDTGPRGFFAHEPVTQVLMLLPRKVSRGVALRYDSTSHGSRNIDFKLNVELEVEERFAAKSPLREPGGCQLQRIS